MPAVTNLIHCDPDILSGEPVFVGTRVPLHNVIDYLSAGDCCAGAGGRSAGGTCASSLTSRYRVNWWRC